MDGIDYAWGRPDFDALVEQQVRFVMRYVSHDRTKDLDVAELRELRRRGISVGLVFESVANRALSGWDAGVEDATYARDRCWQLDLGVPVYFAVDFDVTDAAKPTVREYLRGCASVLNAARVGVYGGYYIVRFLHDEQPGVCSWYWQTYAWSGGQLHPAAHIHQHRNGVLVAGVQADLNRALQQLIGVDPELDPPPPNRKPAAELRKRRGYWSWVQWRLGEQNWKGWGRANAQVRPDVPKMIPLAWFADLAEFLRRRKK